MYRNLFLLIFVYRVSSEDCVTVNFENYFEKDFNNDGVCSGTGLHPWNITQYSSGNSPHPKSTNFISPETNNSCVSLSKFNITAKGKLEVNVFTIQGSPLDLLIIRVFQHRVEGDVLIASTLHIPNATQTWETISMDIDGYETFEVYIVFQSMTFSTHSIIWIDSIRYIGPSSNVNSCMIYEDQFTTIDNADVTKAPTTTATETTTEALYTSTKTTSLTTPELPPTFTSETTTFADVEFTTKASTITTKTITTTTQASNPDTPKEDCVTVNFESNFETDFTNNSEICVGSSAWDLVQYSDVNIESPHSRSTKFITSQARRSCVSSFSFIINAGGILEVNVYTMPVSIFDTLTITVHQSIVGGNDILINTVFHNINSVPEWETIRITINGISSFEGYVTFQARTASANSIIYIDSFRYISATFDKDLCVIYKGGTTVSPTTVSPNTVSPTTEAPNDDCVTGNFEYNFEHDFFDNYGVCFEFSGWDVQNYSSVNIDRPHPKSTRFIRPQTGKSCVSSFKFKITARSTLEVNVFMIPASPFDQLNVKVFQSVIDGDDVIIGTARLTSSPAQVWEIISVPISGYGSFEGYVTFQAWSISATPVIWIDSFRYIAPSIEKDSCMIYDENHITTTTTTEATTTPTESYKDCVTVDFETKFEEEFTHNYGICEGLLPWDLKKYSSVDIDSPHPESASFIASRSGISCTSSFIFPMMSGGTLDVYLYMVATTSVDQITVTVFQSNVEGDDIRRSRVFHNNNTELVPGWQTLTLSITGPAKFDGYVTFDAMTFSSNPIIWIDSFRYIGTSSDKDSCLIYQ